MYEGDFYSIWSCRKADIITFNLILWSNSNHSDPLSWAPLLGNRSGPESSLWWKITHFHAPILLKISSTEKSIELCSTKSWRLFFEIWRSEQRNIFVKLKLFGYFFLADKAIWTNILKKILGSTDFFRYEEVNNEIYL